MTPDTPSIGHVEDASGTEMPESYAFVLNVNHLADTNYTLAPGHELRRAKPDEVTVIKDTLKSLGPAPQQYYLQMWEQRWPPGNRETEFFPEEQWRYFVIAFKGSNATLSELESAFDLAPLEIEVGFSVLHFGLGRTSSRGIGWHAGRLLHVLENARFNDAFFVDVSASDISDVRAIYDQLQQHDHRLLDVKRLAIQLSQLKGLPHGSPLRFLGYFGGFCP